MRKLSTIALLISALTTSSIYADNLLNTGKVTTTHPVTQKETEVKIFNRLNVDNEFRAIRFFFTYTCPYGEKYDEEMAIWGGTLPKSFRYVRVPVITQEPNSMVGAFAYYAAAETDKTKLNNFQRQVYRLVKDEMKDPSDQFTYLKAAKAAGMNPEVYKRNWSTPRTVRLVRNAAILGQKYKIESTPTLTIGGLYTLTPEPIADSKTSFIDFANAITSKYISENRTAIQ